MSESTKNKINNLAKDLVPKMGQIREMQRIVDALDSEISYNKKLLLALMQQHNIKSLPEHGITIGYQYGNPFLKITK